MAAISVVVPSFNRGHLIGETLDAIVRQTFAAHEIIVVDDGSTDRTDDIIAARGGKIKYIRIDNSGELVARNLGVRAATGELVAFCDSDDLWMPEFLETMAAQWEATPSLFAGYANFLILRDGALSARSKFDDAPADFWTGLRQVRPGSGVFEAPFAARLLSFQPFFPSCMVVARAAFLAAGGWDEAVSRLVGNDFATTLRVALHPPVGVVNRPLVAIRKHCSNYSADTEKMNLGDALVLEHVLRSRPELAPLAAEIKASIAQRRCQALDSAFSRRDFPEVRRIYALLPQTAPTPKHRIKRAIAFLLGS